MKKPLIAVDIDDVIAESTEVYRKKINQHVGADLQPEDYKIEAPYWSYYEQVWRNHGIFEQIDAKALQKEMESDQKHIPLMPGAEFALSELSRHYDIVLVTARNPAWEQATKDWLKQQFGALAPEVYFSQAHTGAKGAKTKGQICQELGASWMIDDNPEHCHTVIESGVGAILFGQYGWHLDVPKDVVRCANWQAVLEFFEQERQHERQTRQ